MDLIDAIIENNNMLNICEPDPVSALELALELESDPKIEPILDSDPDPDENKLNEDPDELPDPLESPKEKNIDIYTTRTITIIKMTLGFDNIPFI